MNTNCKDKAGEILDEMLGVRGVPGDCQHHSPAELWVCLCLSKDEYGLCGVLRQLGSSSEGKTALGWRSVRSGRTLAGAQSSTGAGSGTWGNCGVDFSVVLVC